MNSSTRNPPRAMISNYHIDLWEHASKLYRLCHWQQAADIFEFLGKDIGSAKERTLCLVNKALVEARLGDYDKAVLTVADAAELGEDLPITALLAGLINCELSQLALAEAWFEACLTGLNEGDLDYSGDGLSFVLERVAVVHNLESTDQARSAQELGFDDAAPDDLCYLPAELLFEAPPRSREPSPAESTCRLPFEDEILSAATASGTQRAPEVLSRVPSSAYSVASLSQDSSAPLISDEIVASPDRISFERKVPASPASARQKKPTHTPIVIDPSVALSSPAQPSPATAAKELRSLHRIRERERAIYADGGSPTTPRTKIPYTWHGQQRLRHEPRDARGVSDSTRELAHFVQEFAPEGKYLKRKIMSEDERMRRVWDAELAVAPASPGSGHENVPARRGVGPDEDVEDNAVAEPRQRAATMDVNGKRPMLSQTVSTPARGGSLLRHIRSPRNLHGEPLRPKRSKVRWPFQDDRDADPEVPVSTAPAVGTGLKPAPLDFIMGPDGKTIVIEKAATTAPTVAEALQRVNEARRHRGGDEDEQEDELQEGPRHIVASPVSLASRRGHGVESPSVDLPMLHPTTYEPPSRRRRQDARAEQTPASPIGPHRGPLPPSRPSISAPYHPRHQTLDNLTPPPLFASPRPPSSASPGVATPRSGSRFVPSVVSSIHMWDYLLEKIKPADEEAGRKGRN